MLRRGRFLLPRLVKAVSHATLLLEWMHEYGPKSRHLLSLLVRSSKLIAVTTACRVYSVAVSPAVVHGDKFSVQYWRDDQLAALHCSITLFFVADRRTGFLAKPEVEIRHFSSHGRARDAPRRCISNISRTRRMSALNFRLICVR